MIDHGPDYSDKGTPPPEARRAVNSILRRTKLGLLQALPSDRLSEDSLRLVREESRVFADGKVGSTFSGIQSIGSPISAEALVAASEQDIVRAFEKLPDASGWDHPKRRMAGGNIQLSREFADFARDAPHRAAKVLRELSPQTGTRAAGYALSAMAEKADPDLVCDVFRDVVFRGFDGEEFRGSCASALSRLSRRDFVVPHDVAAILEGWLQTPVTDLQEKGDDSSQAASDVEVTSEGGETSHTEGAEREHSILWDTSGMVMLPHGNFPILDCLMNLYLHRGDPDGLIDLFQRHLERGEETAIWQPLVYRLVQVQPGDPTRLVEFVRALFSRHPALSGTREAGFFLGQFHWRHPEVVKELMLVCKQATNPTVQQYFGELVALVALVQPEQQWARDEFDALLLPNVPLAARHGGMETASHLWNEEKALPEATRWLVAAMPLADARGWEIIIDLFRQFQDLQPGTCTTALLEAIADYLPTTFEADPTYLVSALASLLPHNADLVSRIASRLVDVQRARLADLRTGHSAVVPDLVDLAITLHRAGAASREAGIALFEQLMNLDAYLARQTFDEIDNRFRATAMPRQRRLPRRSQRRKTRRATRPAESR